MFTAVLGRAVHLAAVALLALLTLIAGAGAAFAQLKAYVANQDDNTLSVIDVATNTTVGTIPMTGSPAFLAINAAGNRAYVSLEGANAVAVFDLATSSVIATVPVGSRPVPLTLRGDDAFLYVSNTSANTVSVIDTATNTVATTLTVGLHPYAIATTPDGASVWVWAGDKTISVINTATQTITSTFDVAASSFVRGIVFTPDGALAYLTDLFNCLVIDTATQTVVATIPTGSLPFGNAITADGATVYQTNQNSDSVSVIDTATNTVTATVPVGTYPNGIAITPDGAFVYVANGDSNTVSVINTATNAVVATIPVGAFPVGIAFAGEAETEEPPVLTSDNASVTVNEGQTAANTGTVTDANGDTVTLTASVGTVVNNGNGTWSWSFITSDGPTQSQTVTITGDDGPARILPDSTSTTSFSLTVNNLPPSIVNVSNNGPVITGNPATITVTANDPAGAADPLAYQFDCDNNGVFEIGPQAGNSASCTFASAGSRTVTVRVTDGDGGAATGSTVVTVLGPPPNCSTAVVSPNRIWPPNHKLVPVQISGISGASTVSVTSIFQDEPTEALGDGNTCPDGTGTGTAIANLRAERSAMGDGRVYTISFTATGAGGSCQGSVQVCVPHNNNGSCGNGGAVVNSAVCGSGPGTLQSSAPYSGKQHKHLGLLCSSHLPTPQCDLFCDAGLILCH
jgi:YVTN family beta-propeller protein